MLQLILLIIGLEMKLIAFVISCFSKFMGWVVSKPGRWLVYHPFQFSTGVLGSTIAFTLVRPEMVVIGSAFVLGGSLAHLFDSTVADRNQKIPLFLYPFTGALAGTCLSATRIESMLAIMIALALACGCYQQAHSK